MAASSKPGGDLMRDGDQRWTDEATTPPSGSPLASTPCSAGARSDQASCSHRPHPGRSARALLIFCAAMETCHPALSAVFPTSGGLFQPSGALMHMSMVAMCKQPEPRSPQSASTSALEADCSALVSNYTCTPRSDDSTYYFTAQEAQRAARGTIREKRYDLSHPGVHHTWRARSAAASWLIDSRTCGGFGGSPGFSQLINRTVRGPTSWGLVFK